MDIQSTRISVVAYTKHDRMPAVSAVHRWSGSGRKLHTLARNVHAHLFHASWHQCTGVDIAVDIPSLVWLTIFLWKPRGDSLGCQLEFGNAFGKSVSNTVTRLEN